MRHSKLNALDIPLAHQQPKHLPLKIAHDRIIPQNRTRPLRLISQLETEQSNSFQQQFHGMNP
ncbi:hypothetical protein D3C81_2137830 [compost metagenome]